MFKNKRQKTESLDYESLPTLASLPESMKVIPENISDEEPVKVSRFPIIVLVIGLILIGCLAFGLSQNKASSEGVQTDSRETVLATTTETEEETEPETAIETEPETVMTQESNDESEAEDSYIFKSALDQDLNVRSEPSYTSDLVTTASSFEYLQDARRGPGSDGETHYWYQVRTSDGDKGWIRSDLALIDFQGNTCVLVSSEDGLNIRSKPQHDSELVFYNSYAEVYYDGEYAEGVGSDGEVHYWYHIRLANDEGGWVRSDYVLLVQELEN